ncbi:MAG: hypothetical protein ACYCUW_01765 [bacterium]
MRKILLLLIAILFIGSATFSGPARAATPGGKTTNAKDIAVLHPTEHNIAAYLAMKKPKKITVSAGETISIGLSQKQINRIHFDSYITKASVSKTSPVSIVISGREMIVKFIPTGSLSSNGRVTKIEYPTVSSPAIITTKKGIFTIVFVPKPHISTRTVFIVIKKSGKVGMLK